MFPNLNNAMKRGVVFAGRDLKIIAKAIHEKTPFYALTGIMPTSEQIHLGTKTVVENLKYFQDNGAETYILVADLEAAAARGVSLDESRKRALNFYIPAYIALGLDPKKTRFYFQSENTSVIKTAFEASRQITFNEIRAIYGNTEPGRIMSAVTQIGDMLYPQLKHRKPGIIPVGIDQDPHIRLARDYINKNRSKRFSTLSSIYYKYTPSLDGSIKMSKSAASASISLPEDTESVLKKIKRAKTGGRNTEAEQRTLGGQPEICLVFELDKQHLMDDKELDDIYKKCKSGKRLCGECKGICCNKMTEFMNDFNRKFHEAKKDITKIDFIKE
jgi:tryptophanyl-tRNA synthetase